MWIPAARAKLARDARAYATGLTDAEWAIIAPFVPAPARTGRPRRWSMRAILDAILYVLRTGAAWRHLPREFPPWPTVHRWSLFLSRTGLFERLAHALAMTGRERAGRDTSPTAGVIDAQSARSGGVGVAGERGFDPARRVVERKRHILTARTGGCCWPLSLAPTSTTAMAAWPFCGSRVASGPFSRAASPTAHTREHALAARRRSGSRLWARIQVRGALRSSPGAG